MAKTLTAKTYEKSYDWNGYEIRKTKKGFMVSFWNRIQGNTDGDKYLYKFDDTFTPDTDLNSELNEFHTFGEYLAATIRDQYRTDKEYGRKSNVVCLAKGIEVK